MNKHDRTHCESKTFRGHNCCDGYSYFNIDERRIYIICPCSCHEGISEEETLNKIEEDKKKSND